MKVPCKQGKQELAQAPVLDISSVPQGKINMYQNIRVKTEATDKGRLFPTYSKKCQDVSTSHYA
jgi:hypothetical protein